MIVIAEAVMLAVRRDPHDGGAFTCEGAAQCKRPTQGFRRFEAGVSQQSVKA